MWSQDEFADFIENFLDSSCISSKELHGLKFAKRLTENVREMSDDDHQSLVRAGYSDEEILHLVQVTSYFNFVNRMAEGLGVTMETTDHFDIEL
ncbi:carboxymuconolactone decarboxylase family protein [Candidatus Uabimicrobium amorphum]|uniref:carboxymuconolactone decarboxylase family protein n=1 Tax=Uabimicrobium amorphum TaxID=2596890 RepID=UPI00125F3DD0|nr:peroxidase [Candidatus Uabimicrobium amorphum]